MLQYFFFSVFTGHGYVKKVMVAKRHQYLSTAAVVEILSGRSGIVTTPGGDARVHCLISGNASVQWLVNGSSIENLNLSNVETAIDRMGGYTLGELTLTNISVIHNKTRVTCVATVRTGSASVVSNASAVILIQG